MKGFLLKWLINVVALLAVVKLISGVSVDRWESAVFAGLVLGLVNAFLRPMVILFTLPLNVLSLGLFTFVINAAMFYLVSKIVAGFEIIDFWSAFWGALIFSLASFILNLFLNSQGRLSRYSYRDNFKEKPRRDDVIDVEAKKID